MKATTLRFYDIHCCFSIIVTIVWARVEKYLSRTFTAVHLAKTGCSKNSFLTIFVHPPHTDFNTDFTVYLIHSGTERRENRWARA
jgi:hypothetical protein